MNKELQEKLFKDFPRLFSERNKPQKTYMSFGCQCQDGWYNLIRYTCVQLSRCKCDVVFTGIKEKFGDLVLCFGTDFNPIKWWQFWRWFEGNPHKIVRKAIKRSSQICEWCGNSGSQKNEDPSDSWIRTLCNQCKEKAKAGYRPWLK